LFVGTSNGKFYRSTNGGSTWNQATGFTGPSGFWLYGSSILASTQDEDLVWFAGSGYSNPPVWKSTDGGQTFTDMSDGLPATLVQEIAANTNETLLFAATEVGPYLYIACKNKWYPLTGTTTPLQQYYSVEYVPGENIVRFATYGRGIWDFDIETAPGACATPTGLATTNITANSATIGWLPAWCAVKYRVQYRKTGNAWITLNPTTPSANLTNLMAASTYQWRVRTLCPGNVWTAWSGIQNFNTPASTPQPQNDVLTQRNSETSGLDKEKSRIEVSASPNPFPGRLKLTFTPAPARPLDLTMVDVSGKIVWSGRSSSGSGSFDVDATGLPDGMYLLHVRDGVTQQVMKVMKI
jgi:hypothetical protein